jgi:hypothetical protein
VKDNTTDTPGSHVALRNAKNDFHSEGSHTGRAALRSKKAHCLDQSWLSLCIQPEELSNPIKLLQHMHTWFMVLENCWETLPCAWLWPMSLCPHGPVGMWVMQVCLTQSHWAFAWTWTSGNVSNDACISVYYQVTRGWHVHPSRACTIVYYLMNSFMYRHASTQTWTLVRTSVLSCTSANSVCLSIQIFFSIF